MGFFTSEPSGYYQSVLNTVPASSSENMQDTSNRIRQNVAQQVSGRGMGIGRGAYASLVTRGETDAAIAAQQRKQQEAMQRAQLAMSAPVTPSAVSQFGAPLLGGMGYGMGPAVGKGLASGVADLWNWGAGQFSDAYNALKGTPGANFDQSWGNYASQAVPYADLVGVASTPAFDPSWADYASQAFSSIW